MMEVGSRNVDFLEDEFPSIGEIKQDLHLYKLQLDTEISLGKEENVIPQEVTEDRTHVLQRDTENLSVPESQPECQVHSLSCNSDHQVSPCGQDSGSGSLKRENYENSTSLVDRGSGSSSTQQTNAGSSL